MIPMQGISWKRAYAGSAIIHLAIVGIAAVFLAGTVLHQEQQQMYVVDLASSDLSSSGSGHAGGGGGGSELFPEKLSEAAVAEKTAQVTQSPLTPQPDTSTPVPASDAISSSPAAADASASSAASAGVSTGAASSDGGYGTGSGGGQGSGEGTGEGSGIGSGSGSGVGDGVGDGQGYGEGSGDGQGSGDSGASGTGTGAFDSDGFWSAVNANKSYPPMAVKRGLTGTVNVTVTLDGAGNCIGASADGPSILSKAALNAVYAACPYPNATGQTITINVPVTFNLN